MTTVLDVQRAVLARCFDIGRIGADGEAKLIATITGVVGREGIAG